VKAPRRPWKSSDAPADDWLEWLGDIVESRRVKAALAVLIVISVLPGAYDRRYWPLFIGAFAIELAIRGALLWRRGREATGGHRGPLLDESARARSLEPQAGRGAGQDHPRGR